MTAVEATPATDVPTPSLDRTTVAVVSVLALAAFMSVLDGTIVTTAIGTFSTVFRAEVSTVVWVSVGYLLAAGLALPIAGWATEHFGGRRTFLAAVALFLAGSTLSAVSWSAGSLIAFRVVQGFGGGMLEPTAMTLAARMAGPARVGRVIGIMSLIVNIAPVLGPLTGGLFATEAHWRWVFLLNLPIGAVVVAAALSVVPPLEPDADRRAVDLWGLALLSPGFVGLLFAIDRLGARAAAWEIAVPALAGLALLGAYGWRALRVEGPVIDLRLLRRRRFAASLVVMAMVGFVMYSQLVSLPLYLHRVHGYEGVGQGTLTTALGLGLLASMSWGSRRSDVLGPRRLVGLGAPVTGVGLAIFALVQAHASVPALAVLFVAIGLGFGLVAAPTFASVYRTVPDDAAAQATTTMFIAVQLAASLGVTVIGLVLSSPTSLTFGPVFGVLAAAAAVAALVGRQLPGRP